MSTQLLFFSDTVSSITEKQKILQKHRQEIEEIEQTSDREVSSAHNAIAKCLLFIDVIDVLIFSVYRQERIVQFGVKGWYTVGCYVTNNCKRGDEPLHP